MRPAHSAPPERCPIYGWRSTNYRRYLDLGRRCVSPSGFLNPMRRSGVRWCGAPKQAAIERRLHGEPHVRPSRRCETVQVNGGRVRYARNGTVRLAYRVFGEAENTVVWTPGAARNVESFDDPASPFATLAKQLSQVTRLVVWDMRGGGLSDAATQVPPLTDASRTFVP